MKPQDVVILLKIIALENDNWQQLPLAFSLKMSQSEVSQSVARSKFAGLLDDTGKRVLRQALNDFLQYGLAVVFPVKPGAIVRGIPTAHSAALGDEKLYELLSLVDALRVGKAREKNLAIQELNRRIC